MSQPHARAEASPRVPIDSIIVSKTAKMARQCFAGGEARRRPIFHIFGRPGSGRRSLAEAACLEAGVPLLAADLRSGGPASGKAEFLWRLGRESLLQNAAIFVEHFDDLLEGDCSLALASLLHTIETFEVPLAFLSGVREWRPASGKTNVPFVSLPCPPPTPQDRIQSWRHHLGSIHSLTESDIASLAGSFDFTDGQTRDAVASAQSMLFWEGRQGTPLGLDAIRTACRKLVLPSLGHLAPRVDRKGRWESLKLPEPQIRQLREIAAHIRHSAEVYGKWGFAREFPYGLGLAALFEGTSLR